MDMIQIWLQLFYITGSDDSTADMPEPAPVATGNALRCLCYVTDQTALPHRPPILDHRRRTTEYTACLSHSSAWPSPGGSPHRPHLVPHKACRYSHNKPLHLVLSHSPSRERHGVCCSDMCPLQQSYIQHYAIVSAVVHS